MTRSIAPPRSFISYSHDSAPHKEWVLTFATILRNRGVDAVLDQWELRPGDDLPHFMETQIPTCDFVLMICTDTYIQKANQGSGGVGYEKMIMTSSLLERIDNNKAIPIIRQNGTKNVPTFMSTKLYIDFSRDDELEYAFDDLLRHLLNAPLFQKPEIGKNPFMPMNEARPDRTSDGIKSVMTSIVDTYDGHDKDYIFFSKLVRKTSLHRLTLDRYLKEAVREGLVEWLGDATVRITEKGRQYVFDHGVVGD